MAPSHLTFTFVLHAFLLSLPSASSQNCSWVQDVEPAPALNSTGQASFRFGTANDKINLNPFYLSVTLAETRRANNDARDWIQSWLSVHQDTRGYACVYMLGGVNASARSGGLNGCDGVISPACISGLRGLNMSSTDKCEALDVSDELRKVCGDGGLGTVFHSTTSTGKPVNISDPTCSVPPPPPAPITLPPSYRSRSIFGLGLLDRDSNASSFEWYDLHVQQPVPWVIASTLYPERDSDEVQRDTQVVCLAPDKVVEGSRKPELTFKPQEEPKDQKPEDAKPSEKPKGNGAGEQRGRAAMGGVVAAAVGLMFVYV